VKSERRRPHSGKAKKKYLKEYNLGDAFGLEYFGLAYARLLLRNEPALCIPIAFFFKYDLGDVFCLDFCCLFTLGDAFGPGYCGLAYARLLLRNEPALCIPIAFFFILSMIWAMYSA
jgi:hypothetical protein